jgi:ribosomally synthesized peptide (two-chain TOMM family)
VEEEIEMSADLNNFKDAWSIAVALAWEDDSFRQLLLSNPNAALADERIEYTLPTRVQLIVVEEGDPALNASIEMNKDAALVAVLPKTPDDLNKGATKLADYLRRIDPPKNISCLC